MPSTATITSFYSFAANTVIRSAYHNNNFDVFRGHFIPVDPNTATAATTKTYDLGSTDYCWRTGYVGLLSADTVSASSIVGTTITATSLVATTATVTSLVATTLTATSLVATTGTVTSLVATTLTVTTVVATSVTVSNIINLTGGQIKFPASQSASADANTLDDYEEGTFTPVVTGTSAAGTASYAEQRGIYTKIGRMVMLSIYVSWTSHTGTGNISITGIPFSTTNDFYTASAGFVNNISLTASNLLQGYLGASNAVISVVQTPVGGGGNSAVPMDAAGAMIFTVVYNV